MRCLYLVKATIKNFRSIESLHLKNIGDITIFVGPNESGKSNILLALKWFGNDKPLSEEDLPVDRDIEENEVIVELYFKIVDNHQFWNLLESKINEVVKGLIKEGSSISFENLRGIKLSYLKFQKLADGSHSEYLFDDELNLLNATIVKAIGDQLLRNIDILTIFDNILRERLQSILLANNVPENQIPSGINAIKNHPNISTTLNTLVNKLSSFGTPSTLADLTPKLNELRPIINSAPNTNITLGISGRNIVINPQKLFSEIYNQMLIKLKINPENILQKALKKLKPSFVYLKEEMELKGKIVKADSWSNTLRDDNEYAINYRLFKVLGIDLQKFDEMDVGKQRLLLENKLDEFSNRLIELWKQQRIRIVANVAPNEINLYIKEVDKANNPIKTTFPEARSRGFKWYLAYLITLEYLKNSERDTILLLDDPAVFLHERGQKDFLKTLEDTSKNVQIFYNTHLISLFDEKELDRVLLVELNEKHRTVVKKPWTSRIEEVAAPVYHALGFDKLIFEKVNKILFVEGITDKFVFEGLQSVDKSLGEWYVHPLSGGDTLEENELIERIKLLSCLSGHRNIEYYFVLDGDRREMVEKIDNEELKKKILLLGMESQELEDLFNKDFYLNCVLECYRNIFVDKKDSFETVKKIIEKFKEKPPENKITKKIDEEFRKNGLSFSKVDVAIFVKRKLKKNEFEEKDVKDLLEEIKRKIKDAKIKTDK